MKKYFKGIFSKEMAIVFFIIAMGTMESTPDIFIEIAVWSITAIVLFTSIAKNYIMYFKREEAKTILHKYAKVNQVKNHSLFFKLYSFLIFIIPLILNPVLTFIYLDSLTLSIIWGILLIEGINYYFCVKKLKKDFLIGEKNA